MTEKISPVLEGVAETLLIPLFIRAKEACREDALLKDKTAVELVKRIDFDFSRIKLQEHDVLGLILRVREFDRFARDFLVKNPDGVDSAVSCRRMLIDKDVRRLEKAGVSIPRKENGDPDCVVELSPLTFLDDEDVAAYIADKGIKSPGRGEKVYYG